jgi:hypothetical protein
MNVVKRAWPRGEQYLGFFRGPTTPALDVRIRDARDVRPEETACQGPLCEKPIAKSPSD